MKNTAKLWFGLIVSIFLFALVVLSVVLVNFEAHFSENENNLSEATSTATEFEPDVIYKSSLDWDNKKSLTCDIGQGHSCAKEFKIDKPTQKLDVSVRTITWKSHYTDTYLIVSLWKNSIGGELVIEQKIATQLLQDQNIYNFALSDINLQNGKYVISFTSDELYKPIALAIDRNQQGKEFIRDGKIMQNMDLKILIKR